jgi:hypothetical protein
MSKEQTYQHAVRNGPPIEQQWIIRVHHVLHAFHFEFDSQVALWYAIDQSMVLPLTTQKECIMSMQQNEGGRAMGILVHVRES